LTALGRRRVEGAGIEVRRKLLEAGVGGGDLALAVTAHYAGGDEPGTGRLEDEPDLGLRRGWGQRVLDAAPVAPPRDGAVESEAHRIENCGLTGAGRPDQGEEVRVGEVQCGGCPEDGESVHVQAQRSHALTPSQPASGTRRTAR